MMDINELAKQGISKIRLPEWNKLAYLEIEILENSLVGAWAKLYDYAGSGSHEPTNLPVVLIWSDKYIPHPPPLRRVSRQTKGNDDDRV